MTDAMTREAYRAGRRVFDVEPRPGEAVETLVGSSGFNASSARDAVENLGHVLRGRVPKRLNSLATAEHALGRIGEDYGAACVRHALAALESHRLWGRPLRPIGDAGSSRRPTCDGC